MQAITPKVARMTRPQTAIRRLLRPALRIRAGRDSHAQSVLPAPRAASASSPQGWSYYCVECLSPYARGRASPYFPSGIRAARLGLDALGRMAYRIYPTTNTVDFDTVARSVHSGDSAAGPGCPTPHLPGLRGRQAANLPGDYGPPNGGLLLARVRVRPRAARCSPSAGLLRRLLRDEAARRAPGWTWPRRGRRRWHRRSSP